VLPENQRSVEKYFYNRVCRFIKNLACIAVHAFQRIRRNQLEHRRWAKPKKKKMVLLKSGTANFRQNFQMKNGTAGIAEKEMIDAADSIADAIWIAVQRKSKISALNELKIPLQQAAGNALAIAVQTPGQTWVGVKMPADRDVLDKAAVFQV
jgi:hypothetical protein